MVIGGWPVDAELNVMTAVEFPAAKASQSTVASTRTSGLDGETEPELGVRCNQETFEMAVNVNGDGPPAPTAMYRELKGTRESMVIVGGGQL